MTWKSRHLFICVIVNLLSFLFLFCPSILPEGDSELHKHVGCKVQVWGGLHMHGQGAVLGELRKMQKAAADDHSRWVSEPIRQEGASWSILQHPESHSLAIKCIGHKESCTVVHIVSARRSIHVFKEMYVFVWPGKGEPAPPAFSTGHQTAAVDPCNFPTSVQGFPASRLFHQCLLFQTSGTSSMLR